MLLNISHFNKTQAHRQIQNSDIPVFVCYAIISVIGCVCNGITIVVMAYSPWLHTLYNFLLLNLAVADLISSTFSIVKLVVVICVDQSNALSDLSATLICQFFTITIYCSIILSVVTLTAISLERYFGIVKPLIHRNMTTNRLKYFLLFAWPTAVLGPLVLSGELEMDQTTYYCFFSSDESNWSLSKIIIGWIGLSFMYIVPFIVITIVYSKIIIHMRLKQEATEQDPRSAQLAIQKKTKTIRRLMLITVLFAVAILPELVYFAMILFDREHVDAALFYKIGIPTVAINAVNPFIYTLSSPTFRSAVVRFLRRSGQRRVAPLPPSTEATAQTR